MILYQDATQTTIQNLSNVQNLTGVPLAPGGLGAGDDVDRLEVARPTDPSDPYLRHWTKTLPGPIKFDGSPCAFPSRVWKSESSALQTPTWNMLCDVHGGESWSRFTSTTPTLMEWKLADQTFTIPPVGGYDNTEVCVIGKEHWSLWFLSTFVVIHSNQLPRQASDCTPQDEMKELTVEMHSVSFCLYRVARCFFRFPTRCLEAART